MTRVATHVSGVFKAAACVCLITICVHLAGSAVFSGILSGPLGVLASPIVSLFGFPYLLPELLGVGLQWIVYRPQKGRWHFLIVMLVSVALAAAFMGLLGIREQGSEGLWALAGATGAATSAAVSLILVRFAKLALQGRRGSPQEDGGR